MTNLPLPLFPMSKTVEGALCDTNGSYQASLFFEALNKRFRSCLELFLVVPRTEVIGLAFIDRFRSRRRVNIHIAYGTDGTLFESGFIQP